MDHASVFLKVIPLPSFGMCYYPHIYSRKHLHFASLMSIYHLLFLLGSYLLPYDDQLSLTHLRKGRGMLFQRDVFLLSLLPRLTMASLATAITVHPCIFCLDVNTVILIFFFISQSLRRYCVCLFYYSSER